MGYGTVDDACNPVIVRGGKAVDRSTQSTLIITIPASQARHPNWGPAITE